MSRACEYRSAAASGSTARAAVAASYSSVAAVTPVRRATAWRTVSSWRRSGSWASSPTVAVGGVSRTVPSSGTRSPASTRSSVDLPVPLGATRPSRSPGARVSETASSTVTAPKDTDTSRAMSVERWPWAMEISSEVADGGHGSEGSAHGTTRRPATLSGGVEFTSSPVTGAPMAPS